jgi:hypothetical protein
MRIKKYHLAINFIISIPLFSQQNSENKGVFMKKKILSRFWSKKEFVKENVLFVEELIDLDLYNDITSDKTSIPWIKCRLWIIDWVVEIKTRGNECQISFRIEYNESLENCNQVFFEIQKSLCRLMAILWILFSIIWRGVRKAKCTLRD